MRTAYKVRAYPDPGQAVLLSRTFGCVRVVWNRTLSARQERYTVEKEFAPYRQTDAALSAWKKTDELSFLSEVSSVPLQQALRHQHNAFQSFFAERGRYPRFRSRRGRQKGSANRARARVEVAHARARDARRDFLHKTSTGLVRRFDRAGVEDLAVGNMVRNRSLSKAISRCG